jgi:rhodanese-related sulfurtransferase
MQVTTDERLLQENESMAAKGESGTVAKTPGELAEIVSQFASSDGWMEKVRLRTDRRWYERLYFGPDHDIWVISWLPGQSTGYHDHGDSSGALVVATGILEEHRPGEPVRVIYPGRPLAFGIEYAHDVRNVSLAPAISVHAYSPPLHDMNEYELDGGRLVPRDSAVRETERVEQEWQVRRPDALSIDDVLSGARARLQRLSPDEAHAATVKSGAILVDIRPAGQRAVEGEIAGAVIVERNVLEWRFDPKSSARLRVATDHDIHVIVFCSEGYTSSLAALALKELGLWRATDMIGGFQAWKETGLPIVLAKHGNGQNHTT